MKVFEESSSFSKLADNTDDGVDGLIENFQVVDKGNSSESFAVEHLKKVEHGRSKERLNTRNVKFKMNLSGEEASYEEVCAAEQLEKDVRILVFDPGGRFGVCSQPQAKWKGPAIILSCISIWSYKIRWKGKIFIRHRDHLCPLPVRNQSLFSYFGIF